MMNVHQIELEKLGLSAAEAGIYLALLRKGGAFGASAVAAATRIPRSSAYLALNSLAEMGLVEAEAGYAGRFSAVAPQRALQSLIDRESEEIEQRKQELSQREKLAGEIARKLGELAQPVESTGEAELVQVLKDPRVIAERFLRLELEAERQLEVFCKPPVFIREGNSPQTKAMGRGVRVRGLYERASLDIEIVRSNLGKWLSDGEEARAYDGELPHKLALFDRQNILMPLITPAGEGRTLFVRSPQLGASLGMLFDSIWAQSQPVRVRSATKAQADGQNSSPRHKRGNSTASARKGRIA